ncbi:cytochrome c3 family protein [Myxococcota bacterium]|nr:cytochrome c3 family protein [Myxococcota bacterium]
MQVRALTALVLSTGLGAFYVAPFVGLGDGTRHLPGRTSDGHHQIESACASCHDAMTGATNERCLACHGADLEASEDSHSEAKFRDPRNAERIAAMDASRCTTCHAEHTPGRTRVGGVTVPADFCVRCHADIAEERPSHADFRFDGCAASGCHNFHDNRALYRDYLLRHADAPDVLPVALVPARSATVAEPNPSERCEECHAREREGFLRGRHGMRLAQGLSPMSPRLGRLELRAEALDETLGCTTCHGAHVNDTAKAAVDACLGCHDDAHSRAYERSKHFALWEAELAGRGPPGSGVSCATCHMPRQRVREKGVEVVRVDHDQNGNLRPSTKMLRTVCTRCHGLALSIDALADAELAGPKCFEGRPSRRVESIELARRHARENPNQREEKKDGKD